ncbi:MAG: penicillin-binding protein activator [Rhodobacter sp.]|nr:penicillin-binding protein activator [Rhodobacter sp.]
MIVFASMTRRRLLRALAALSCAALTACNTVTAPPERIQADAPVAVALLVPAESGIAENDLLAEGIENAVRLAMGDMRGVTIDLRVYATAANPERAAEAALQAVDEGAGIILGPLYAGSTEAVGAAVARSGVNVLSLSNSTDIAGDNVFVLGNTFENTAERLVKYALDSNRSRIMVVHGQGQTEEKGFAAISAAMERQGAELVSVASFEMSQNAVVEIAPEIAATAESEGAEAIFLTSGNAGALPILTQLMVENGLDPETVQLIGLQRWDIPSSALELAPLQGGWFALPSPWSIRKYEERYHAAYGKRPHPVSSIAYDGIAMIGALVGSGRSRTLSANALTEPTGFAGVNGVFRLRPDGTNERGLAVATIFEKRVAVIDPAPIGFGGAGF